MGKAKDSKPLALSNTLRDLALLRVSEIDTTALLPSTQTSNSIATDAPTDDAVDLSVESSYLFVKEARTVMKIYNRGEVGAQGVRVEDVRSKLDELAVGMQRNN